jgi:hypothetical protein
MATMQDIVNDMTLPMEGPGLPSWTPGVNEGRAIIDMAVLNNEGYPQASWANQYPAGTQWGMILPWVAFMFGNGHADNGKWLLEVSNIVQWVWLKSAGKWQKNPSYPRNPTGQILWRRDRSPQRIFPETSPGALPYSTNYVFPMFKDGYEIYLLHNGEGDGWLAPDGNDVYSVVVECSARLVARPGFTLDTTGAVVYMQIGNDVYPTINGVPIFGGKIGGVDVYAQGSTSRCIQVTNQLKTGYFALANWGPIVVDSTIRASSVAQMPSEAWFRANPIPSLTTGTATQEPGYSAIKVLYQGDSTMKGADKVGSTPEFQFTSPRGYVTVGLRAAGYTVTVIGAPGYANEPRNGSDQPIAAQGGIRMGPLDGQVTVYSLGEAAAAANASSVSGADWLTIAMGGANDVFAGIQPPDLGNFWRGYLTRMKALRPKGWILACGLPPSNGQATQAQISDVRNAIAEFDTGPGSRVVNCNVTTGIPGWNNSVHLVADGTHESDAGAQLMATFMLSMIASRITPYLKTGKSPTGVITPPIVITPPATPNVPNTGDWGTGLKDAKVRWLDDGTEPRAEMTTASLPQAVAGEPYSFVVQATGSGDITFSGSGFPSGFEITPAGEIINTGQAAGVVWDDQAIQWDFPVFWAAAPSFGTYRVTIIPTDANGAGTPRQYDLIVNAAPVLPSGNLVGSVWAQKLLKR